MPLTSEAKKAIDFAWSVSKVVSVKVHSHHRWNKYLGQIAAGSSLSDRPCCEQGKLLQLMPDGKQSSFQIHRQLTADFC